MTGLVIALVQIPGISIHTPAKGVTMENEYAAKNYVISIHTPAKGVTPEQPDLHQKP